MNRLGVMSYVYMGLPLETILREMEQHDLQYIQIDPKQKLQLMDDELLSPKRAELIRRSLEEKGISMIAMSAYSNLVNPNLEKREAKLQQLEKMIDLCPAYGTRYIATETGSFHPTNSWRDCEENHTEEGWQQLCASIDRLRNRAVKNGVTLLIEGFATNVLSRPDQAVRLLEELGSEGLQFIMDPFNYLTEEQLQPEKQQEALDHIFAQLAPHTPIAHAKDTIYVEEGIKTPRVGTGLVKWELYASLLSSKLPDVPLIIEHAQPDEVGEIIGLIKQAFSHSV